MQLIKVNASQNPSEVYALGTPEICVINKGEANTENGITVFEETIVNILDYFNVEWKLMQIRECAEIAFSEYYWLQFAELKQFVLKLKAGDYREVYSLTKIAPDSLLKCLSLYASEAMDLRMSLELHTKKDKWVEPENPVDPKKVDEFFSSFATVIQKEVQDDLKENLKFEPKQSTYPKNRNDWQNNIERLKNS